VNGGGRVAQLEILVPDLPQAIELFCALGYELRNRGPSVCGDDGRVLSAARLALAVGPDLVVQQLDNARGAPLLPRWGLDSHPCWCVDDMSAAVAALRELSLARHNRVLDRFGPEAGSNSTYIHFPTPWGMDLELISSPHGIALDREPEAPRLWDPCRVRMSEAVDAEGGHDEGNGGEGRGGRDDGPGRGGDSPRRRHGLPTIRGTAHMGLRVPQLEQALEFFVNRLGCRLAYRHAALQRSGGRWTELSDDRHVPAFDATAPDDRFQAGTQIRVAFVRCANFNFELMELLTADTAGKLRPAFDRDAASVMQPVFQVDSVAEAGDELQRAGAVRADLRPGSSQWLTPWGQALALCGRQSLAA
jgi:catechol 2,3-dioxygenase-like lactoylglutathione lyase family enzyme